MCKVFPDNSHFLDRIQQLAIIDGDCNVLLVRGRELLVHCLMLQRSESEAEKRAIRDYMCLDGNFDLLTVSNIV